MLRDGYILFESKRYREAAAYFEAAVQRQPEDAEAAYWLGASLAAFGDDEGAVVWLGRAAQRPDVTHAACHQAGLIYLRQRRFDLAEDTMRAALVARPSWHAALVGLARALLGQRRLDEAEDVARTAAAVAPGDPEAPGLLGSVAFARRRFEDAEAAFREQLDCAPDDASAAYNLARAVVAQGRVEDALVLLRRAVGLSPRLPRAELRLATLSMKQAHWADAEASLRRLLLADPDNRTLMILLGEALFWRGDYDGVTQLMEQVVSKSGTVPRAARLLMARRWLVAGKLARVVWNLDRLLTSDPEWLEARLLRAQLLIVQDLPREAEDLLVTLMGERPGAEAPLRLYCELLAAEDRIEDALGILETWAGRPRRLPHDLAAWLVLAYVKLGRRKDAERILGAIEPDALPAHLRDLMLTAQAPAVAPPAGKGGAVAASEASAASPSSAVPAATVFLPPGMSVLGEDRADGTFQDIPGLKPRPVWQLLSQRPSIIMGAMMHDMSQRFAERRLGYMWALITPLIYITIMTVAFSFIRHRQPAGMSLPLFLLTGLMVWQAFQGVQGAAARIIRRSNAVVPRATFIDLFIAATALEMLTQLCVGLLFVLGLVILGVEVPWPNVPRLFVVLGTLYIMSLGFGSMIFSLRTQFPIINEFNTILHRVMFLTSGIFFSISDLPSTIAGWIWFNPLMHVVELTRQAFLPHFPVHEVLLAYPLGFGMVGFLFGILIHRRTAASRTA